MIPINKLTYWFTTLTLVEQFSNLDLESLLTKHCSHYCICEEYGKSKSFRHIHLVCAMKDKKKYNEKTRTDKITAFFKENLYKGCFTNKKTVVTKKCENYQELMVHYLFKEQTDLTTIKYYGFEYDEMKELFANKKNVFKNYMTLNLKDAPYKLYETLKKLAELEGIPVRNYFKSCHSSDGLHLPDRNLTMALREMMKENWSVHHLQGYYDQLSWGILSLYMIDETQE